METNHDHIDSFWHIQMSQKARIVRSAFPPEGPNWSWWYHSIWWGVTDVKIILLPARRNISRHVFVPPLPYVNEGKLQKKKNKKKTSTSRFVWFFFDISEILRADVVKNILVEEVAVEGILPRIQIWVQSSASCCDNKYYFCVDYYSITFSLFSVQMVDKKKVKQIWLQMSLTEALEYRANICAEKWD